ncbi:MAG: heme NO-binding domain-containing protein [Gammaproteobacteria bacterium]|nr:heme NO-binding domain-containing protein [Gammaproteobacteria bacterium]NVK87108.1 heme NO-binding domain-containing protein [Gammaproteobacteria bacterium]
MIGLIYITLEKVVTTEFGEETWEKLLQHAQLDGGYQSLTNYSDEDIVKLVTAASELLKLSQEEVLRWFGEQAIVDFHRRWPDMFARFDHVFDFILSLNAIIHPHVRQLYPDAAVPHFNLVERGQHTLIIEYLSKRQMCHLAEGLTLGAGKLFNQPLSLSQSQCRHRGDGKCLLKIVLD